MNKIINESEQLVYDICRRSFLSLWSYANPLGNDLKELCDILIVCDPDIIIISVKDINAKDSGDITTDWNRWCKKAIGASVKQIYGAERWIERATNVIRKDGSIGIKFPDVEVRRIHRIAVALGVDRKFPIMFGDFGKGFVHVFDRISLKIVMGELDTKTDFVEYLAAKESLYLSKKKTLCSGGEEDLLALYLHKGRVFPVNFDIMIIDETLWRRFKEKAEFKSKKEVDKTSYIWDRLVEMLCSDILHGNLEFGPDLNDSEKSVRTMARENRFSRRLLGKSFIEFYGLASEKKVRSRIAVGKSNTTYVFLAIPENNDRKYRVAELGVRCIVARGLFKDNKTVVGLATERYEEGKGYSFDLAYLYMPVWSDVLQKQMEYAQRELRLFNEPRQNQIYEDEYPKI